MTQGQTLAKLLDERLDDYVDTAVKWVARAEGFEQDELIRQAHRGFAMVIRGAVDGDMRPRDRYIDSAVRGLHDQGLGIDALMRGMVQTASLVTAWATENGAAESIPWLIEFFGDYTVRLAQVYAE